MKNFLNNLKKVKRNRGQALIISVIFFLFISLAIVTGLVSPSVRHFKIANDLILSKQSFLLSESGIEDAYFRLKNAMNIDDTEIITLNGNTATTSIVDAGGEQTISTVGDTSNRERTNELVLTAGVGVSFSYGVQVGTGGFTMNNGSSVQGSVYSNGPITGSGAITGSATSANSSALAEDQSNGSGVPPYDITFANSNANEDFAQSFQVSNTNILSKVQIYIKKVTTPAGCTVRIMNDLSGVPGPTTHSSGTLNNAAVSTTYGWVDVTFTTNPNYELTAGTTYWLVIDCAWNASRYYIIGANSDGYGYGIGKIGKRGGTWNDTSPVGLDGFFKVYLGGFTGLISGITIGSAGVGNAYANTINSSTVAGTKYCQSTNNSPACNTTLPDPAQIAMPISDQNIIDWQAEAAAGGTTTPSGGTYNVNGTSTSLGPQKIAGNLTVSNNGHLTITGTVYVTGNVDISNNAYVALSPSYGSSEGVMIVDGNVNIGNNANFSGSGTSGSYLMVLSTSSSASAITLSNNAGAVILYAANGTVNLSNNASAKALNGKYIALSNNATVYYDSGLVNSNFVNGPSGGWSVTSWKEIK